MSSSSRGSWIVVRRKLLVTLDVDFAGDTGPAAEKGLSALLLERAHCMTEPLKNITL